MADGNNFLGRGWSFPPRVDAATGRFIMCEGEDDIREAIYIIVMTRLSERAMMPEFGCDVHSYVFDLPDSDTTTMMETEILKALSYWEPRVVDVSVEVDDEELYKGKVIIEINYVVRATNNPNNLVFPYYLYEGVGLE